MNLIRKALCLLIAVSVLIGAVYCTPAVAASDTASFSVYAMYGEKATLTVSAPATVTVGESFELTLQWTDYIDVEYVSAFSVEFAFDTRYMVFETPCATCVDIVETQVYWVDCCNYGEGKGLAGVEATDKSKPSMMIVNIGFATDGFDEGTRETCTIKIKCKAVYAGTVSFDWIYAQFTDMKYEHEISCDMTGAAMEIVVKEGDDTEDTASGTQNTDSESNNGNNRGDVNEDGEIDSLDAASILRYDTWLEDFTAKQMQLGDVNYDSFADSLDAATILRFDAGLITEF